MGENLKAYRSLTGNESKWYKAICILCIPKTGFQIRPDFLKGKFLVNRNPRIHSRISVTLLTGSPRHKTINCPLPISIFFSSCHDDSLLWCNPLQNQVVSTTKLPWNLTVFRFQDQRDYSKDGASCLGEVCKFQDLRAHIQRELRLSSQQSNFERSSLGLELKLHLKQWQRGWGGKTPTIETGAESQGLPRFETGILDAATALFFFFPPERQNRTQAPSPGSPNWVSRSSWCTGSYEHKQMLQRNVSIAQLFQACLRIFSSEDVLVRTQTL